MTTLKFKKITDHDFYTGKEIRYELNDFCIVKESYNVWGISRNGCYMYSVPTLKIAKSVVLGTIKIESK